MPIPQFQSNSTNPGLIAIEQAPCLTEQMSLMEACEALLGTSLEYGGVVSQGRVVGLLGTEGVLRAIATGCRPHTTPVSDWMISPVPLITLGFSLEQVQHCFKSCELPTLPVVDEAGAFLGVTRPPVAYKNTADGEAALKQLVLQSPNPVFWVDEHRTIFEQAPLGFCQTDLEGRIVRANPWFCNLLGYSQEAITQYTFQALTDPEDLLLDLQENARLMAGEIRTFSMEKRYLSAKGEPHWMHLTVYRLDQPDGTPYGSLGIVQDIRDLKRSEEALNYSQERFALVTAESYIGVWDWDLTLDKIYVSPNLKALLGYAEAEIPSAPAHWATLVHPEDLPAVTAAARAYLAGHIDHYEITYRMVHKNGSLRWFLTRGWGVRDEAGHPLRMTGTNTDITAIKQAENALRASHEQVADILESISDAFFALNQQWQFTYINQRAEQLLNQSRQTLLGKCVWEAFPEAQQSQFYHAYHRAIAEQESQVFEEFYGPLKMWFEVHANPTQEGLAVYFQDITERKQADAQLQHQIQREKALNRVIRSIRQSLDLDQVFSTAAREVQSLVGATWVTVVRYIPDAHCWRVIATFSDPPEVHWVGREVDDLNNPLADRLRQFEVVHLDDTTALTDPVNQAIVEDSQEAWLLVPLDTGLEVPWGSLSIGRQRDRGPWQQSEVELAEIVAEHLAIAIQQAHSYEQAQIELAERQRTEERLKEAQRIARIGNWEIDVLTGAMTCSTEFSLFDPLPHPHPIYIEDYLSHVHPEDQGRLIETLEAVKVTAQPFQIEYRLYTPTDQALKYVQLSGSAECDAQGRVLRLFGTVIDITERRNFEQQLAYEAYHDPLTGAPNRTFFMEALHAASHQLAHHPEYDFAILFIDLDRFKIINDSLGHLAGDQILIACVERLSTVVNESSNRLFARLSGDEFALLLDGIESLDEAIAAADQIHEVLQPPFLIEGREMFVTASVGIASSLRGAIDPVDCLRNADIAMFRAKAQGRSRYVLFDPAMHAQDSTRLVLETDLQRAVSRQELHVVYQPIVSLKTGELNGFEALLRWHHSRFGIIRPSDFIPLAEETGLILSIGRWTCQEACRRMRQWQDQFPQAAALTISVNLSVKQFANLNILERIAETLAETRLPGKNLRLEITESALIDNPELAMEILQKLQECGIQLCIDDFGTGYSSLSMVHQYPLQVLKIDRSFISRLEIDNRGVTMVRTILALAHSLGMEAIAEGVETEGQLRILQELGCESAQGYYFSPPVSHSCAEAMIESCQGWWISDKSPSGSTHGVGA